MKNTYSSYYFQFSYNYFKFEENEKVLRKRQICSTIMLLFACAVLVIKWKRKRYSRDDKFGFQK